MNEHDDLSHALHAMVDDEPTGAAPVPELMRRGRAAARNRVAGRSALTVGALAAIGVGGVAAFGGVPGSGTAPQHGATTRHASAGGTDRPSGNPAIRLASAVEKTANTSFQVRTLDNGMEPGHSSHCVGAWDPKKRVGWNKGYEDGSKVTEVRIIRGDYYEWFGPGGSAPVGWQKIDLKAYKEKVEKGGGDAKHAVDSFYCGGARTATLQGVLKDMKDEGPIRDLGRKTRNGKEYEVYSVTSTKPVIGDGSYNTTQAWVGVESGYIEQMWSWDAPKGAKAVPERAVYSHFGDPVEVTRPPAD